ncbi:hypothetical protein FHS14_000024 [Paenibacillus baekrokdamisoli]|nr:hypothetical protein [Paenibacillus baekrokdamisoli]
MNNKAGIQGSKFASLDARFYYQFDTRLNELSP